MYADNKTIVRNKEEIQAGTDNNVGCANNRIMSQIGGKMPFDNLPKGIENVKLFHDMYSPLLSDRKFVNNGKYILVFGSNDVHVVNGRTGELVKEIMKQTRKENSDDIVMTVPFDEKH